MIAIADAPRMAPPSMSCPTVGPSPFSEKHSMHSRRRHLLGKLLHALRRRRDQSLRQALGDSSRLGARQKRKQRSQRRSCVRPLLPGVRLVRNR